MHTSIVTIITLVLPILIVASPFRQHQASLSPSIPDSDLLSPAISNIGSKPSSSSSSPPSSPTSKSSSSSSTSHSNLCGLFHGQSCADSQHGPSCSFFGKCGPLSDRVYSGWGCQEDFGVCARGPYISSPAAHNLGVGETEPRREQQQPDVKVSPDGRCGEVEGGLVLTCLGSPFGACCSSKQGGTCGGAEVCKAGGRMGWWREQEGRWMRKGGEGNGGELR